MIGDYENVQPILYNILSNEVKNNKVSHAYLFDISSCHNSFPIIYGFIKSILCPDNKIKNNGCEKCNLCKSIDDKSFPDIVIIEPDGLTIKKEQLLDLQNNFKTKSLYNNKKIYIIKYAENLHSAAANSILKFLEEPENNIIAILLTKNLNNVLSTIISRCQVLNFISDNNIELSTKEKIGQIIFYDNEEYQKFLEDDNENDMIDGVIKFINYYENNGISILSHSTNYWFDIFSDKKNNIIGYNLMLLFYKDVINYKLNRKLEIYESYNDSIKLVSTKNTLDKLYKKIHFINEAINRNKININLSLNLDNLILNMEGA